MSSRLPTSFRRLRTMPVAAPSQRLFSTHSSPAMPLYPATAWTSAEHARSVKMFSARPMISTPLHDLVGDPEQPGRVQGLCGVKPIASRALKEGEICFQESGEVLPKPTMHSVQVSENGHVNIHGEGRFLSHSFNPNLVVRIHECSSHPIDFVARRDIAEGETLSFNYCTTEWDMASPFTDSTAAVTKSPGGELWPSEVRGFKHLPAHAKLACLREGLLPPHTLRLWLLDLHATDAKAGNGDAPLA